MDGAQTPTPELISLLAIRQGRADFFDRVIAHAEAHRGSNLAGCLDPEDRKLLRSETVSQIAELFFAIDEAGLTTPEALAGFLHRHNADMQANIAASHRGYTRFGVSCKRIQAATFSEQQINFIIHESSSGVVTFDQRSIAKLLTEVMSFESCRTALLALARFGLIHRHEFGSIVLIRSNGVLETIFRDHLRTIHHIIIN